MTDIPILGPDNKPVSLLVDAAGNLLVSHELSQESALPVGTRLASVVRVGDGQEVTLSPY